ncbi:hypothetical protein NIIDNTM18_43600 [Mycolicibacterium litorale]|uniref:Sugar O-methyltransferase n=1 Tax=Mycolicibacterium litorale TaxID=758802 RepID=A0A6S6PAE6_9MYCO|nr:hypothetical protein [Mycolicibacterium litorale]BCI55082.1 hypothetical protein NIIDNTM18_43600 [Mycolicibacterium litorale]
MPSDQNDTAAGWGSLAGLATRFARQFDAVRHCVDPRYVRADWAERNAQLARDLLPVPPHDFLCHPAIRFQMLMGERIVPYELPFVRERLGDDALLAEDRVGEPPTVPVPGTHIQTSPNTVHQLHHLLRYEEATGRRVRDASTVVEWGGGFGSLMRLLVRLHGGDPTCVVIDTPVFAALQWLYLSATLGEDRVVLHHRGPVRPEAGRVNVVPIGLVGDLDVDADLFISNWALNESMPAAQRDVVARGWFGAESLLLAMHAGDPFAAVVLDHGARAVLLGDFMPGQQYLVR